MINIQISEQYQDFVDQSVIEKAVNTVITELNIGENIALSVVIENDLMLQALNNEYLGIDSGTDVLSFSADEWDPETEERYLGDVVISYQQAEKQALTSGHPTKSEIELLVVHGVLHLLGYDHSSDLEKETMWEIQKKILQRLDTDLRRFPE